MSNTIFKTTAVAIAVALAAGGLAIAQAAEEQTLRLSTYVNEVDIRHQGFQKFAELAAAKTQGRVRVEIFPSATLHGWSESVDAVQSGISDISWIPADNRLPCYRVTSLYPTSINLDDQIKLDADYADLIREEAAKVNLVPLINSNYSYDQEWWFKDAVDSLGKLDGKLVRSIGPLVSMMIENWGGKPVFIAPKEVFQSAERGVVDGINMGVATYSSWKLWGVMPYMVNANLFYGNIIYMLNKDKFDSLSPPDRQALMSAAREAEEWLKPRYEGWINERVGNAVMTGGGAAVSIADNDRDRLIGSVTQPWNAEVDAACGVALADKIRGLFKNHAR